MKKLVRTNLTNTPNRRGTKDLNIQFYSHDKNNAGFEFVVKNETDLSQYAAKILFKFRDSNSTWQSNGTVEGNVVKVSFNTDLIARCEEVLGFLFLDSDSDSLDVFKFKFNVVLSEIDKNEVEKRRIKHVENISSFELVTRAELKEVLAKLQINGGVDLSNYLTTEKAEEIYATKNEIPSINGFATTNDITEAKKSVVEEIKKLGYAKATEVPVAYNDSALLKRVTNLENKIDKDTVYDDSALKTRVQALENRPTVTAYNDKPLSDRVSALETKDTIYDDEPIKERLTTLESKPFDTYLTKTKADEFFVKKTDLPEPYNDKALSDRVLILENKQDNDTVYNDTEVKERLTALESKPTTGGGLSSADIATYTNNIIYVPNGNIVYDKNLKKLYIPKCNVKVGKTNYWCEAQEVTINGSAGFIVFNKSQKRIVGGDVNTTNDVLLGYYDNNIGNYYLNTFSKVLKKKKIACLGDSITEGVNANGWQWHRYIDKYFKENGVETTIVNLGIGGTSVCTSSYVTASLQPFVNRLNTIPTDTDVIVIFGGTNDWGNNATLGTISDTGSSSFYGAYKYMLEWLAINRPNAKILTITPLKRYFRGNSTTWTNAQTTRNNKGQLLQDYVRAVKEVSELYAIPCIDLHNESGLNPVLEIVRTKYMGDGLHPTAEGNKKMYPIILDKLKPLVKYD